MDKIVFIRERTEMGITKPFICQSETDQWFVVKTKAMMPIAQLLAEFIGSTLAERIGLPCPKISFVEITSITNQYAPPGWQSDLPLGTAFASPFFEKAKMAKTAQAKMLCEQDQKWLYMFDRWILNSDRTASMVGTGNINLLYDEISQEILVIDHNLAFDEQANFSQHIFSPQNRSWRLDWIDKQYFTEKAIDILENFADIYQKIPDDWFPFDEEDFQKMEDQIQKIKQLLTRITEEHYWDNIE
ncbi:HipA family kinase [Avibacterium sp. 21-594]|uniref:HipA family kinase n=1 Tax=Avibacterium sp. 21-594 TaxID=2911535 RepID=UPI002247BD93|nr:HipA family kinase [Avibacterium sp. 21-594]MCW9716791.1 toxin HipA [Avibacterium sp. 21-594]